LRRVVETIRHHEPTGRFLADAHGPGNILSYVTVIVDLLFKF